jgi:predicted AAA+ superfamily ATPase
VIIDEFQYAPQLASYLQGIIDEKRSIKGQIVLTGSQNFQMMEQVTQSLAGRIGSHSSEMAFSS